MKLNEILEPVLAPDSSFKGSPVKLLNIYDLKNRDVGRLARIKAQTVVVKNTKTKQTVGKRTIFLKDPKSKKVPLPVDDPRYSSAS